MSIPLLGFGILALSFFCNGLILSYIPTVQTQTSKELSDTAPLSSYKKILEELGVCVCVCEREREREREREFNKKHNSNSSVRCTHYEYKLKFGKLSYLFDIIRTTYNVSSRVSNLINRHILHHDGRIRSIHNYWGESV